MKTIKCFGKEYISIKSLADEYNLSDKTLYARLHRGYTPEEAVTINKMLSKQHSKNNLYHTPLNSLSFLSIWSYLYILLPN